MRPLARFVTAIFGAALAVAAIATPSLVFHSPTNQVFGESSGITMREPDVPREDETTQLWIKIGPSFTYNRVAIYYTTNGTAPTGTRGDGSGSTQVLRSDLGQVNFVRNEPRSGGGNDDWWLATLPVNARVYGNQIQYKISAWDTGSGEEWANTGGSPVTFSFSNKLAWPGAGAGQPNPSAGYPPVNFWKEEAVIGNGYMTAMLDQNGTLYDTYYPGAGAVQGVAPKNEGYSDGADTFPPGLPPDHRGQMHVNQLMTGIRVDGLTHWLSNPNGVSYGGITQNYLGDTNVVQGSATLTYGGANLQVQQYDFVPAGITFPNDQGGFPRQGFHIKRTLITNNSATSKTINFYAYADWAVNGSDQYDLMSIDASRGAMIVTDNTQRNVTAQGNFIPPGNEYNPTSFSGYDKNVSVLFAAALKSPTSVGGSSGPWSNDFWRDTSTDHDKGWIGTKLTLAPGQMKEIDLVIVGGFDNFPNATGTYAYQMAPVLDWFAGQSALTLQTQTQTYWTNWLNDGVTVDFPDNRVDSLFKRSLLASALHIDAKSGAIIAGMHNGAYPFVWPRDTMYAAVSLSRTGHWTEANAALDWMRITAYRGTESWGKGFFYQKYTTDGYIVWSAPQVDETAVYPWAVNFHYLGTGSPTLLSSHWNGIRDSAYAMSSDSGLDSRLRYEESVGLMYSMNVWEDQFDVHLYSNANVIRGLRDAATIAGVLGNFAQQADFEGRANAITSGLRGRLAWNGENTDISQLGITTPFAVIPANDADAQRVLNRINGTATDRFGNNHPLLNTSGEFAGLVNRYWGDGYWGGGPWWLSVLWYAQHYADRADFSPGKTEIDVTKNKLVQLFDFTGPMGMGAEQIAPTSSTSYPGFRLQTAWPNAWESMSTYLDTIMAFLDYEPNAPANTTKFAPKLPTGWSTLTFNGLKMGAHRFDVTVQETDRWAEVRITNRTGAAFAADAWIRAIPGRKMSAAKVNGVAIPLVRDPAAWRARVVGNVSAGVGSVTVLRLEWTASLGDERRKGG